MQGVESAWECVGKKRSFPSAISSVNYSAEAKSKTEGAGVLDVREELRGAEAMTDTPRKGDNVSSLPNKFYNGVENKFLAPTGEIKNNVFLFFFLGAYRGQCAQ